LKKEESLELLEKSNFQLKRRNMIGLKSNQFCYSKIFRLSESIKQAPECNMDALKSADNLKENYQD